MSWDVSEFLLLNAPKIGRARSLRMIFTTVAKAKHSDPVIVFADTFLTAWISQVAEQWLFSFKLLRCWTEHLRCKAYVWHRLTVPEVNWTLRLSRKSTPHEDTWKLKNNSTYYEDWIPLLERVPLQLMGVSAGRFESSRLQSLCCESVACLEDVDHVWFRL